MNSREQRKAEADEHNKKRDLLAKYNKLRLEIAGNNIRSLPPRLINANSHQLQKEVDNLQAILETMEEVDKLQAILKTMIKK